MKELERSKVILAFGVVVLAVILIVFLFSQRSANEKEILTHVTNMKLSSSVFEPGQPIPSKYSCEGENINLPLVIADVPAEAKSLALVMDDPDAPAGTWVHWTVWNISPATAEIPENSVPRGAVEGVTSFGQSGYGGPCPPPGHGTHRYFFKLYALDMTPELGAAADKATLERAMTGHILASAELIGLYSRD